MIRMFFLKRPDVVQEEINSIEVRGSEAITIPMDEFGSAFNPVRDDDGTDETNSNELKETKKEEA